MTIIRKQALPFPALGLGCGRSPQAYAMEIPEVVLEGTLFQLLPPGSAGCLALVCRGWSLPVASSENLWRRWAAKQWAWWPTGALDEDPDALPGTTRRLFQLRVEQERRTDELLIGIGGEETEAAQRELLVGGPFMSAQVYLRAQQPLPPLGGDMSLQFFASQMTRRLVVHDANKQIAALLQAADSAEAPRMQRRLAEARAERPQEAWLEKGALLIERYAKHGGLALNRSAQIDEAAATADAEYVAGRIAAFAALAKQRLPAAGAGGAAAQIPRPLAIVRAVCHVLFELEGISGDEEGYYSPKNSYLSDVLRRKKGIPITLCTLLAAVSVPTTM